MITISDLLTKYINISLDKDNIPILDIGDRMGWTQYIDFIKYDDLSHRLMHGYDKYGRIFLCIRYEICNPDTNQIDKMAITVFQRYSDDIHTFVNGTCYLHNNLFDDRSMNNEYWKQLRELIEIGSYTNILTYRCI